MKATVLSLLSCIFVMLFPQRFRLYMFCLFPLSEPYNPPSWWTIFFMNFLDAVSEGNGQRIMRQYKYLMLLCKADDPHSTNYALESLYQLLLVNGLSQKESEIFVWNRTVNNHGGLGNNIPHDLEVEHSNNFNKQGYCNIGANLSEKALSRIYHAEKHVRNISGKVDRLLQRFIRSGKHIQRIPVVD